MFYPHLFRRLSKCCVVNFQPDGRMKNEHGLSMKIKHVYPQFGFICFLHFCAKQISWYLCIT